MTERRPLGQRAGVSVQRAVWLVPPRRRLPSKAAVGSIPVPSIHSRSPDRGILHGIQKLRRRCNRPSAHGGVGSAREGVRMRQIETSSKKRGMAKASLDLIRAMHDAAKAAQPITGRGIGYKLFTAGLIPSMETKEMQRVYRLLRHAREQGTVPWEWIVDETREFEKVSTWRNPAAYARAVARSYRRDFWLQQPVRC